MSSKCFSEWFAPDKKIALWGHVLSETFFFLPLSPPFLSPAVCGFPKSNMKMKGFLFWEVVIIFFLNMWCWAPLHHWAFRDFSWQCAGRCCRDAGLTLALTHSYFMFKNEFNFIILQLNYLYFYVVLHYSIFFLMKEYMFKGLLSPWGISLTLIV